MSIYAAKSAVVLIFLMIVFRLLGKRDLGQFNVYDLVTVIALSNAVQNAMTGGRGELAIGIAAASALLLVGYIASRVLIRKPGAQRAIYGSPVLLISNGSLVEKQLVKQHVSPEELDTVIREHGITTVGDVSMAVLEIDGSISIVPKHGSSSIDMDLD